ncbi:deoxyhypusine synthase family protein [Moorena sp. SIO2C4]|uniref:deoxyhypusine synthase family protein n=1 Tax=Moorena sp. SIO2C4 TaxID=2607824 RepID=UPI00338EABA4
MFRTGIRTLPLSVLSYSGALPSEKISWGKLDTDTPSYVIESDASIVAPLIFTYVLGH